MDLAVGRMNLQGLGDGLLIFVPALDVRHRRLHRQGFEFFGLNSRM
jgi:hypothetical protein